MVKKGRIILAFVLAIAMLLPSFVVSAGEDSIRNKRIVSIVYDDSGSMYGDNAAYTSYAIQAFTGLLNSTDALYITYMDNPDTAKKVDLTNPLKAVSNIREYTGGTNTPIKTLTTAFNALNSHSDKNPNTQYWLVVLTDGMFDEDSTMKKTQKFVEKAADSTMPNGSSPNIQYIAIGEDSDSFCPKETKKNISARTVKTSEEIVQSIFDISSAISGRYRVEDSEIKLVDDKTVTVSSDIPLINIGILTQNTNAEVTGVTTGDRTGVNIKTNVGIKSPKKDNPCVEGASSSALGLKGNVTLAGEDSKNLPAGEYTIKFDKSVKKENIVIMLEPALEIKIKVFSNDKEITDLSTITTTTPGVTAKTGIYEIGTDTEIPTSLLPSGIRYHIDYSVGGNVLQSSDDAELSDIQIKDGENELSATLDLPGYFTLQASETFTISTVVITDLTAELLPDGSPRRKTKNGKADGPEVIYTDKLDENKTGIKFTAYNSGEPLNVKQAEALLDEFKNSIDAKFKNYEVEILNDGSYLVYPKKPKVGNLIFSLRFSGEQNIAAELNGHRAEGKVVFKADWFKLIIPYILILLAIAVLIYLILWIFKKKRFVKYEKVTVIRGTRTTDDFGHIHAIYSDRKASDDINLSFFTKKNGSGGLINWLSLKPAQAEVGEFTIEACYNLHDVIKSDSSVKTVRVINLKGFGTSNKKKIPKLNEITESESVISDIPLYIQTPKNALFKITVE